MKKLVKASCLVLLFMSSFISAQVKDGDLLKGSKENIYIVIDGKACWIPTADVFNAMKLDLKSVNVIDDAKLNKMSKGNLLFKNKEEKYYLNLNGSAAFIGDASIFTALGLSEKFVVTLPNEVIEKLPAALAVVKGKASAKYLLIAGKVCQFSSDKIFKTLGMNAANIVTVNDKGLAGLTKSPLIVKGEGDKVYVIEKDKRRWITTKEIFSKNNYDWKTVLPIDEKVLKSIPEGKPIN